MAGTALLHRAIGRKSPPAPGDLGVGSQDVEPVRYLVHTRRSG